MRIDLNSELKDKYENGSLTMSDIGNFFLKSGFTIRDNASYEDVRISDLELNGERISRCELETKCGDNPEVFISLEF